MINGGASDKIRMRRIKFKKAIDKSDSSDIIAIVV